MPFAGKSAWVLATSARSCQPPAVRRSLVNRGKRLTNPRHFSDLRGSDRACWHSIWRLRAAREAISASLPLSRVVAAIEARGSTRENCTDNFFCLPIIVSLMRNTWISNPCEGRNLTPPNACPLEEIQRQAKVFRRFGWLQQSCIGGASIGPIALLHERPRC